jgi:hypothetical protein
MKKQTRNRKAMVPAQTSTPASASARLLGDIRFLIENARQRAAQAVNAELTMLYWHIGERIR